MSLLGLEKAIEHSTYETEHHVHNREKWFGAAVSASGETHVADRMVGGIDPFVITTGNDDFGSWVQVLGSSDSPVSAGMVLFDAHRFLITNSSSTDPFVIQVATGESADLAAKIAAEEFTEGPYISGTNNNDSGIEDILTIRTLVGEKVWVRV